MASLYPRPKSPYWWIKYSDPDTGKLIQESTKCRRGNNSEDLKAREICRILTAKERAKQGSVFPAEKWESWVDDFLRVTFLSSPATLCLYRILWKTLYQFLLKKEIPSPRHLSREHCFEYFHWRQAFGH